MTDDVRVAIARPITELEKARDAWLHNCKEQDANARLIADAPDMFKALQWIVRHKTAHPANVRAVASEALAKATGEAP